MVKLITDGMQVSLKPFSFPEAAIILASTKKNDLCKGPTPEDFLSLCARSESSLTNLIAWEYEKITLRMLQKLDLPRGRYFWC